MLTLPPPPRWLARADACPLTIGARFASLGHTLQRSFLAKVSHVSD